MNLLLLGHGKTGSIVAEIARDHGHNLDVLDEPDNTSAAGLTSERLRDIDVVIDFTTPHAVLPNIHACIRERKNMVVGTTGWYEHIPEIKKLVEQANTGFVWAANFSFGVNLFFQIANTAAAAMRYGYSGHILERHHIHKKDAPSGTAVAIRNVIEQVSDAKLEITSERQGEVFGLHQVTLESDADTITLIHDAKSRRGFAQGAILASEWINGSKGFYDFKDIFAQL
jgi:4-hydroxy-tetrahydrodipicolinate reductase